MIKQSRRLIVDERPCGDCKQIKKDIHGHFCPKMLCAVTPDMHVSYYDDEFKGSCFEEKE